MQQLTSEIEKGKHGIIIEETIDSRFVFECERCEKQIDISHHEVNKDGHKCPECWKGYVFSKDVAGRNQNAGRRLLYSSSRDFPNQDEE